MKTLKVRWQRIVTDGKTCPRCESTGHELEKAIFALKKSLAPLGIQVILKKDKLSIARFKKDPLQSNQIWINNRLLEDWINANTGSSPCCDVCGPSECRTIKSKGKSYETIPAHLIIQAGLIAASKLVISKINPLCCGTRKTPAKNCCSEK